MKAKIGRLIIAKQGIAFISSGSNKLGSQLAKNLIPVVGSAMKGESTVDLDSQDFSKPGSLKIPASEISTFRIEGGFMSGRWLNIYSRKYGEFSFMTKNGFSKSEAEELSRLDYLFE